ncbi:MAG: ABC transporter ATP-binding protein [Acidobacteria bacterium]|nr:ABC transporter ATP-binding protein [Acidobacteriota bacterium]
MPEAVNIPLVRASGIAKTYGSGERAVRVFENLDLEVMSGERIAIVGPSGSGKSSLLHILGALDRPTSGRIEIDGDDVAALSDAERARFRNRTVGFVYQFHRLLPEFTALENAMMPLLVAGQKARVARPRALELLERVGLEKRVDHRPGELSGGEAQRVALARALVQRPRVLLADEPTGNLDHRTGDSIHAMLHSVHESEALTSIIVTHNERLAALCDRVLLLDDGRLVAS